MNCVTVPHITMWGKNPYPFPGTFLNSGNRCGHDPKKQAWHKFADPVSKKKIPHQMTKLIKAFRSYFFNPSLLPTLSNPTHKTNLDGQAAKNRSEAREADILVACAVIRLTEFASLKVGTPLATGEFINRSGREIAKVAGLLDPSVNGLPAEPSQRYYRAVTRLKAAGFCEIHTQHERIAGEFDVLPDGTRKPKVRARPAIKNINPDFLVSLGCMTYQELEDFRDTCSKKITAQTKRYKNDNPSFGDTLKATNKIRLRHALGGSIKKLVKPKQDRARPDNNQEREAKRQYALKQLDVMESLRKEYPNQPMDWINKQTRLLLPAPNIKPKS